MQPLVLPARARSRRLPALIGGAVVFLLGCVGLWWLGPDHYRVDSAHILVVRTGQACDSADLELDFQKMVATARPWRHVGGHCEAVLVTLPIEGGRRAELIRAAGLAARGESWRGLLSRESFRGSVHATATSRGKRRSSTMIHEKPEGTSELEAYFAHVVQRGSPVPGPAVTKRPGEETILDGDPRRSDLRDLLDLAMADAQKKAPGCWLEHASVEGIMRGGTFDASRTPLNLVFASSTRSLSYMLMGRQLTLVNEDTKGSRHPIRAARCSSVDLWQKAVAAGMPDAEGGTLWFHVEGSGEGRAGTWTLTPSGAGGDRSQRRVFDPWCNLVTR